MKHWKEVTAAILFAVLAFVVGMRAGLHDAENAIVREKNAAVEAAIKPMRERIEALETELAAEQEIEHIEIEYVPLPVDYPIAEEVPQNVIAMLAQTGFGEDRGIDVRPDHVAAVYETIFNRVDSTDPYFPDTVAEVITQPNAYMGYSPNNPVDARYYSLALDAYYRWQIKRLGLGDYGYTIPDDCVSFASRGDNVNHFRLVDGTEWQWTMRNPYEEAERK